MNFPKIVISASQRLVESFLNKSYDLKEVFLEELNNNESKIVELAQNYQIDRYQVYSLDDISLDEIVDYEGTFNVSYTAYEYNGCKNMEGTKEDDICVDYKIDTDKYELVLIGPELLKRSTYEEF